MKPVPIPDELIPPHYRRFTIGAPLGEETSIRPVEALIPMNTATKKYVMLIELEEGDLEQLGSNGGRIWLQLLGNQLVPFSIDVVDDGEV